MEQKHKDLLVKDLCARLPYNVKCNINFNQKDSTLTTELLQGVMTESISVKPYLRPLCSMTAQERADWSKESHIDYECEYHIDMTIDVENCHLSVDWLNEHHFDYRGLIPMGLALEATEDMYK